MPASSARYRTRERAERSSLPLSDSATASASPRSLKESRRRTRQTCCSVWAATLARAGSMALPFLPEISPTSSRPDFIVTPFTPPAALPGNVRPNLEAHPAQRLAQLQAIYESAPVGLCFLDRNLRYVSINRRLAEMNGVPIAEHLGRTSPRSFPKSSPKVEPYLRRALRARIHQRSRNYQPQKELRRGAILP